MTDVANVSSPSWFEFAQQKSAPLLFFVVSSSVYLCMMSAGILWMDVGELSAAAHNLGGAHPPGHPGHSLLGKLATLIPIGEIATRLSVLSALSAGAALSGTVALVQRFFPKHILLGIAAAVLVGITPALILNATRAEVYTPTFALLAWSLVYLLPFIREDNAPASQAMAGVFLMALAGTIHPAISLSVAMPMLVSLLLSAKKRSLRLLPYAFALCLLAAMLYLYLPIRALALNPGLFVWGDPSSWENFSDLVTASVYQDNFSSSSIGERIAQRLLLLTEGAAFPLFFVGIAGLLFGWITRLRGCGTLLSIVVCVLFASSLQSSLNPDMRAYLGIAYFCLAIGAAVVAMAVSRMIAPSLARNSDNESAALLSTPIVSVVTLMPLLVMALLASPTAALERDRSDDAMQLWDQTISLMPPGPGLFFANGDPLFFVSLYEDLVAGARPDIAVASPAMVRDLWFLEYLRKRLPELYMPYIDDGQKGKIAGRLASKNLQRGFPVWGDALVPQTPFAVPVGRAYAFRTTPPSDGSPLSDLPPLQFQGMVGQKLARLTALRRARFELSRAHLRSAIIAIGLEDRFAIDALPEIVHPSLLPYLPQTSQVFIHEEFQSTLIAEDIAYQLGLEGRNNSGGGMELRIHFAWRLLLSGQYAEAYALLNSLGGAAMATTPAMLVGVGRLDLAAQLLRQRITDNSNDDSALALLASLLANQKTTASRDEAIALFERATEIAPDNAESFSRLGLVYIQRGRAADAKRAWLRALEIEPGRPDTRAYLRKLESQAAPPQPKHQPPPSTTSPPDSLP
ncbi:MAG: DUF2723 domain-containing protein [Kofleriaceae bacterium]|nr:DUF2723 domain-containing protein [Kofleriaceae bacterium]